MTQSRLKTIIITGASGGFGREFSRQLEDACDQLILTGRDKMRLQTTRNLLKKPNSHRIVVADIAVDAGIETLVQAVASQPIVGLVNNAGFGLWGAFTAHDDLAHTSLITTDLTAPIALTHRLLPRLQEEKGFVINVSSLAGESPLSWMGTYSAAKAGLTYWSEALRIEQEGVLRVVTLAPGPSPTGFREVSGMPDMLGEGMRISPQAVVQFALKSLRKGGGFCVPGWRHWVVYLLQKLTPRAVSIRLMHYYLRPRS
ncbi:MAG: SDR family NAD(P)-dependent oxidoreductase [Mariprofundales bacterium]